MMQREVQIKEYARKKGVRLWEVGAALGCNDQNMSRKLRRRFTPEERARVEKIIDGIAASHEQEAAEAAREQEV